ncbi:hypothetical protein EDC01DRAFT_341611 [Geopyxis carbonaria]|nr:hypothetical protein EDC01DRAFT_341611 [Geopyxis carbonaria]
MPSRLSSPVITVDMANISKVDPSNVDNLFSMWTIFSKCAESLENGRRLENLSWRLWNRETFCCDDDEQTIKKTSVSSSSIKKPQKHTSEMFSDIPELSSSVESAPSEDELPKDRSDRVGLETSRPCIIRAASVDRYRGKEKHMTPVHLAKIMEDIDRNKSTAEHWISHRTSQPRNISSMPDERTPDVASISPSNSACEPEPSLRSTHSLIRGFSPGRGVSSYRSSPNISSVVENSTPSKIAPVSVVPQKKPKPVFFLGSSSSSPSDDDLENTYNTRVSNTSSKQFDSFRRLSGDKKTSFRDEVTSRTVYDDEVSSDDELVSESAIEEEDCSDWESSTDSIHSSYDEGAMFRRVQSRPELTSRRSLLSTMLHEPERAAALANAASRSSPAIRARRNSPRSHTIMPVTKEEVQQQQPSGIARSKPIIMTTSNTHPPALSPRTTRRNMLASELTESLRKHLLWERQQKNTTASAHLKRRHTAHDVTKLTEYPTKGNAAKGYSSKNSSWNNYFDQGHNGYHAAGW